MWELLVNGDELKVGDKLRHRIIFGEKDEIIQIFEVIAVDKLVFSARMIKNNDIDIPLESQISWFKEIAKLSESRLQIWITEKTKE
jgi:hypothetical protein